MQKEHTQPAPAAQQAQAIAFPEELAHLEAMNAHLDAALQKADSTVERLDRDYMSAKRYMVQNRGEIDPHEMFQNELALREIDSSGAFAAEVRERIAKLKDSPYFARIDFGPGGEAAAPYYIGRFSFTHESELLIFDWRAPVSGMFYNCEIGQAGYDAPGGRVEGRLTRKRQFKIQNGRIEYAVETSGHVQDDVLLRELSGTADEKMKSIIATIQKEQNQIIRNEKAGTLIIQGVAGSGKTSIALHRIAFLLYRFKDRLSAQNIAIISPNRVFGDYISTVLPELGEEPVFGVGLADIATVQLENIIGFAHERDALETADPAWAERVRYKSTPAFVRQMDAFIAQLPSMVLTVTGYSCEPFSVSEAWVRARLDAYHKHPLMRRLAMVAEDIHDRFTTDNIMGHDLPQPRTILKGLKAMLNYKNTLALYRQFYRQAGLPHMLAMPDRKTLEWNDVFPFLYLHAAFFGLKEGKLIRHVVIDEMQDYSPIQYAVINRLFPCPKTILGDFGQAINSNHRHTLDDLAELYRDAQLVMLNTSYRSTCEIMGFATVLAMLIVHIIYECLHQLVTQHVIYA